MSPGWVAAEWRIDGGSTPVLACNRMRSAVGAQPGPPVCGLMPTRPPPGSRAEPTETNPSLAELWCSATEASTITATTVAMTAPTRANGACGPLGRVARSGRRFGRGAPGSSLRSPC